MKRLEEELKRLPIRTQQLSEWKQTGMVSEKDPRFMELTKSIRPEFLVKEELEDAQVAIERYTQLLSDMRSQLPSFHGGGGRIGSGANDTNDVQTNQITGGEATHLCFTRFGIEFCLDEESCTTIKTASGKKMSKRIMTFGEVIGWEVREPPSKERMVNRKNR